MGHINFKKYLSRFEKSIVVKGFTIGVLGTSQFVSVKNSPINSSTFAYKMGKLLNCEEVLALDYYGYFKKSKGFYLKVKKEREQLGGRQLKMVKSAVIHFNSIKMEDLLKITEDSYLLSNFAEFKCKVLKKRGFTKG